MVTSYFFCLKIHFILRKVPLKSRILRKNKNEAIKLVRFSWILLVLKKFRKIKNK